jgi:hypothetical protein
VPIKINQGLDLIIREREKENPACK